LEFLFVLFQIFYINLAIINLKIFKLSFFIKGNSPSDPLKSRLIFNTTENAHSIFFSLSTLENILLDDNSSINERFLPLVIWKRAKILNK